ncbi:MAG TPA: hypothetical protein VLI94_12590 [Solirubrobacterales bacterium]|nr:hypothetical protein [Solirubrobacterales bacterium]
MEALLEREADVENWNDERLDELSRRIEETATKAEMNQRFGEMNRRFDESAARSERFESKVGAEFHRFTDRLDKLFYIQLFFLVSLAVALMTDQA